MPLTEALVCPVCCRRFKAKAATLKHISNADESNHRDAMEWQVELIQDARYKGLSVHEAAAMGEVWFSADWIAKSWRQTYGAEAAGTRRRKVLGERIKEHHQLHPDFNHFSRYRQAAGSGEANPFFGKTHSPEARKKIGDGNRGKTISDEQIRKFRETHRRHYPTPEAFGEAIRERFRNHPEAKVRLRDARLRQRFVKEWTQPERIMASLLTASGIAFKDHVPVGRTGIVDFLAGRLILEVYGDYWHANPRFYGPRGAPLHPRQVAQREKDGARNKVYQDLGYRVEIFWEYDLLHHERACLKRLEKLGRSLNG